jgi:hypothetical protein
MQQENTLVPISDSGYQVLELIKVDPKEASQLMASLSRPEQVSLVSHQAVRDPKTAQDLLFLLADDESKGVVDELADRALFRIMKSQSSTHIGVLSLTSPDRVQSILDLDQELFSAQGQTDPQTAYHWFVSFLEEDEATFTRLLLHLDIKVVASAFQDKLVAPEVATEDRIEEEDRAAWPADFLVKLDRGELKPEDLTLSDEETRDILTRIHLIDEAYFSVLISLMVREENLSARTAEDAFDRIHSQVGDMSQFTEEAEDMFVPLEE